MHFLFHSILFIFTNKINRVYRYSWSAYWYLAHLMNHIYFRKSQFLTRGYYQHRVNIVFSLFNHLLFLLFCFCSIFFPSPFNRILESFVHSWIQQEKIPTHLTLYTLNNIEKKNIVIHYKANVLYKLYKIIKMIDLKQQDENPLKIQPILMCIWNIIPKFSGYSPTLF